MMANGRRTASNSSISLSVNTGNPQADILPHTKEAGDPYYVGDAYHPQPIPDPPTGILGPYYAHVQSLSAEWLELKYLAQWMAVTTQPTKAKFLNICDKQERGSRTNIAVLDFDVNQSYTRTDYCATTDLQKDFGRGLPDDTNDHVHARLIIVEDLSRDVIETLGARFDIDPLFFRQHISDYSWYNVRDPWVERGDLAIHSRKRTHFHTSYLQSRYFEDEASIAEARRQAGHFNVLRRLEMTGHLNKAIDLRNSDVALIRSKISLWVRPNKDKEKGWLGILLVDPPITEGFPLWGGSRSSIQTPSMYAQAPSGSLRTSILEDFVYRLTESADEDFPAMKAPLNGFPKFILQKIFVMVCAEWLNVLSFVTARLATIDWAMEGQNDVFKLNENHDPESTLIQLAPWRRRLPFYHRMIASAADLILKRSHLVSVPASELADLKPDLEAIQSDLKQLVKQSQVTLSFITASINYFESRRAIEENRGVTRLTYIAVVFAPLSFVATFFSMQPSLGSLNTFKVYCMVAFPLTFILLLFLRLQWLWERVGLWLRGIFGPLGGFL